MTQPTSQKLADALAAEPCAPEYEERRQIMAKGALQDHYHEYFGHGPAPIMELHDHCLEIGMEALAARVCEGEFNGSKEESDAFFASPEGQKLKNALPATLQALLGLAPPPDPELLAAKTAMLCAAISRELNGENAVPTVRYLLLVAPIDAAGNTKQIAVGSNLPDSAIPVFMKGVLEQLGTEAAPAAAEEGATVQ